MAEAEMIVKKQECAFQTKPCVWIKTADGHLRKVEPHVAILCETICKEMHSGHGCCMDDPISLPSIKHTLLNMVLNYCLYHHVSGIPDKQRNAFDENLLEMDANLLCELMYVAHYLQVKSLVDRTCEAMVKRIEKLSSVDELYHMLSCPDNVTKEEHLSRIKILSKLIKEKNKEKEEGENMMKFAVVKKPRHHEDTRSIDDLLAFIDGGNGGSKGVLSSEKKKKKKKKSKKRDGQKNDPFPCAVSSSDKACVLKKVIESPDKISSQDLNASEATSIGFQSTCSISTMVADKLNLSNTRDKSFIFEDDFDDGDFDPSPSEEIDREVEEFAQRLILKTPLIYFDSSSQEVAKYSVKGNGS